jgi:flagellar assembly protein FliH
MSEAVPLDSLGRPKGFRSDARYARAAETSQAFTPEPDAPADDPIALAFTEGFTAGCAAAQAQADETARIEAEAREALSLSFARLDDELQEELRLRLRDTVAALCEAALAPLALDEGALTRRIERAVSMMQRADDERIVRLHPDDVGLLSPQMTMEWQIVPDSSLERGSLRIESASGGIEDGPAVWRRAIAEALKQC